MHRGTLLATAIFLGLAALATAEPPSGYWAFQTPADTPPPQSPSSWIRTPVDAFVLAKLDEAGLAPSPEAEPRQLVRRVYLDLTGLPPTPEQVSAFLDDPSPRAYEDLVERLMASPQYGERWALKWLDVVRYADTNGFEQDAFREQAWRYRDYVVRAFQNDKPYDRFLQEQLAGDEMFPGDRDALIATGFLRLGPRHVVGGNQDKEEARQEVLTEIAQSVGSGMLGLTVHCARCHNHKFDPIPQTDYYKLQAFFAPVELEDISIASAEEKSAYEKALESHKARLKPIQDKLAELEQPYKDQAFELNKQTLEPAFLAALETPEDKRSPEQEALAKDAKKQASPKWYEYVPLIPKDVMERRTVLRKQMHAIDLEKPDSPPAAFAVRNTSEEPPTTYVLKIGDYRHKLDPVPAGFLEAVGPLGIDVPQGAEGRRTALAKWITRPEHPLTARVMANRIWQFRMGGGLVDDANNFGLLGGASPSHPELLDFLAENFIQMGWSVKAIDRMVVLSAAYRQSSAIDPAKAAKDADNKLYWRANRRRLEAEAIRDSILAVSGELNSEVGGKPIRIPIEPEIYDLIFTEGEPDNLWSVTPDPAQHNRRSLYLINKRTIRFPLLANFDQPDTMSSCAVRPTSTHALQALAMLNSDFITKQSRAFARRLQKDCGDDRSCQIEQAYALTLARKPTQEERSLAAEFFADNETRLSDFCLALVNRNEFVYRP
ncbi:MAG: DUF1549 and DUF1553 domain-containing protein [Bryobacterales bacterium]